MWYGSAATPVDVKWALLVIKKITDFVNKKWIEELVPVQMKILVDLNPGLNSRKSSFS
jgi:hypothetical protein